MAVVRGASAGFSILLLGGVMAPLASHTPTVGRYWLAAVAVAGFLLAGSRTGAGRGSVLQGVMAAVGAYLLILPIVIASRGGEQIPLTLGVAVVAGGLAAYLTGLRRRGAS
ncbi:hypothetical protein ACWFR5_14555 [Streptomyces sp. NPDC055092]